MHILECIPANLNICALAIYAASCCTSHVPSSYLPIGTLVSLNSCGVCPLMQLHAAPSQAPWPTHASTHLCL